MTDDISSSEVTHGDIPAGAALRLEPEDLDGHTVDELSEYLESGRTPPNPSIDESPLCRNALAALQRLHDVAMSLSDEDAAADSARDDSWIDNILAAINIDARAGRDFPLEVAPPNAELVMTEGALRALVRSIGDHVPGFLIGRVTFTGDLQSPGEPVAISLTVTIVEGFAIPESVAALRATIAAEVTRHTALDITDIDITVQDLQTIAERQSGAGA